MTLEDDAVQWYAMRAYKNEVRAEEQINAHPALECFVAKRYELRTYHGKRVKKLVPLIPSLIFVRGRRSEIQQFKQRNQYLQYIGSSINEGRFRALVVPCQQMEAFIAIARQHESDIKYMTPSEVALVKGCRVRIIGGTFDGVEGVLLYDKAKNSNRVVVSLPESLGSISSAEISPDLIEVI